MTSDDWIKQREKLVSQIQALDMNDLTENMDCNGGFLDGSNWAKREVLALLVSTGGKERMSLQEHLSLLKLRIMQKQTKYMRAEVVRIIDDVEKEVKGVVSQIQAKIDSLTTERKGKIGEVPKESYVICEMEGEITALKWVKKALLEGSVTEPETPSRRLLRTCLSHRKKEGSGGKKE